MTIYTNEERAYGKANLAEYMTTVAPNGENADATQVRVAFHEHYKRALNENVTDEMVYLVCASSEEPEDITWYLERLLEVEEETAQTVMAGGQAFVALMDKAVATINADTELNDFVLDVAKAADLPPKAPAHIAYRLEQDFGKNGNVPGRIAVIDTFPDPWSEQKEGKDGNEKEVSDSAKAQYHWDYYNKTNSIERRPSKFADLFDKTNAGVSILTILNALRDTEKNTPIVIEGNTIHTKEISSQQRKALVQQVSGWRSRLTEAYRTGVAVLRQWQGIEDRFGAKRDDTGKVTDIGKVRVSWVYQDVTDKSRGLAISKALIRITAIIQDGELEGQLSDQSEDMIVSKFLNLDLDAAMEKGGRYLHLIESKKKKVTATTKEKGKVAEGKDQAGMTKLPTAKETPTVVSWLALQADSEGYRKALRSEITKMSRDDAKEFFSNIRKVHRQWDDLLTPEALKLADEFDAEESEAEQKELDEKLKQSR